MDSMLPCVRSVIDHRRRQNVIRKSVTHSAIASCATFLFLPHFDVICDLLLNRRTTTWNLFVNRNNLKSLGELEKAVETLTCGSCSHSISPSPKLPFVFL